MNLHNYIGEYLCTDTIRDMNVYDDFVCVYTFYMVLLR